MFVKTGDTVKVIAGKSRGLTGKVIKALPLYLLLYHLKKIPKEMRMQNQTCCDTVRTNVYSST